MGDSVSERRVWAVIRRVWVVARAVGIFSVMFSAMCWVIYIQADDRTNGDGRRAAAAQRAEIEAAFGAPQPRVAEEALPFCDSSDVRRLAGIAAVRSLPGAMLRQFEELPEQTTNARRTCQVVAWAPVMKTQNAWLTFYVEHDGPGRVLVTFPPQTYRLREDR